MLGTIFILLVALVPAFLVYLMCTALIRHLRESRRAQRSDVPFHRLAVLAGIALGIAAFGALHGVWLLLIISFPATWGALVAGYTAIECQRINARRLREALTQLTEQGACPAAEASREESVSAA